MGQKILIKDLLEDAKSAEASGDLSTAATLYEKGLKQNSRTELLYRRLMILYRKLKKPKEELRIINAGIKNFEQMFKEKTAAMYKNNRRISHLSKAIIKSLQSGKHAESLYEPAPVPEWKHRKALILQRLDKARSNKINRGG